MKVIRAWNHGSRVWALVGEIEGPMGQRKVADRYTLTSGVRCLNWTASQEEAKRWRGDPLAAEREAYRSTIAGAR